MNALIKFFWDILAFLFPFQGKQVVPDKPQPPPKPVQGLFSMDLFGLKDIVGKVLDNPMTVGAFNNKVDLSKQFNLPFTCYLLPNSDQNYSLSLVSEGKVQGIKLTFNHTCPKLYAEKFFSVETEIDFIFLTKEYIRISLVGLPDFFINLK